MAFAIWRSPDEGKLVMTPVEAQTLQDDAKARGTWLAWVVTDADPEFRGRFVARVHTANHQGGVYLPGALVAETLGELRVMLPAGLEHHGRTSLDPPDVVEVWD